MAWLSWFYHGCLRTNRPLDPDVSERKQIANFVVGACWVGWTCYKQIAALSPRELPAITVQPQQCVSAPPSAHPDEWPFHQTAETLWWGFNLRRNATEQHSAELRDYITTCGDISSAARVSFHSKKTVNREQSYFLILKTYFTGYLSYWICIKTIKIINI